MVETTNDFLIYKITIDSNVILNLFVNRLTQLFLHATVRYNQ